MKNDNNAPKKGRRNLSTFQPPLKGSKNNGNVKNGTKGFSSNKRQGNFKCS